MQQPPPGPPPGHQQEREAAFVRIVGEHARFLYRVAHSLLRHPQDAEDAVQDALLKLYRGESGRALLASGSLRDERAFLARVVWRAALDRHAARPVTAEDDTAAQRLADTRPTPESAARRTHILAPATASVHVLTLPPLTPPVLPRATQIGGGGGQHDIAPAAKGHLPKLAQQQILPPQAPTSVLKLAVEPTVVVQKDLKMADNTLPNLGMPSSSLRGISLGNGSGTGLGPGSGSGIGPGSGGNLGGGAMHIGGAVLAPKVLVQVDPEFSEEARKAKFSGNVEVYLWVDANGNPSHVRVVRGVGMGLDQKAVDAVRQYKFKPATKNGKPVTVDMYIDVNFQIF
jgi:protein TonB